MAYSRRDFLGAVTLATSVSALACGDQTPDRTDPDEDPLGVRGDFPVVGESTYLNSAYITPSPTPVVRAGVRFLEAKGSAPVPLGDMMDETDAVRRKFAALIGASPAEIGLLFATSDGENLVARSLALGSGDNVVVDDLHYETTYVLYRHLAETRGVELRIVPSRGGAAPAAAFAEYVDARTRLISVAWVSHQNGYTHDLGPLADLAHAHGAYLYADAIQGIGMLSLDVRAAGVDFLTAGTYKWLLGGFGVAPFYVHAPLLDLVAIDRMGSLNIARELGDFRYELHTDGRKYGYATQAFGPVFQLSAALDYLARVGVERIERHTVALAHRLHAGLTAQGFPVDTPAGNRSAIVTFAHGRDPDEVNADLASARVQVSLKANGTRIRVAPALFNTARDVDRFLDLATGWS